jgi:hypothetical protein
MKLNTENPHHFTYQTDELLIELLGAIRIDYTGQDESNNESNSSKQEAYCLFKQCRTGLDYQ